jgi:hypothetical protein
MNETLNANLNPTFKKTWNRRAANQPPTAQHRWNSRSRDKLEAHAIVRVALRKGSLRRGRCEVCGSYRVDAHHDDYTQPLVVRWLCRRHHQRLHADLRCAAAASLEGGAK